MIVSAAHILEHLSPEMLVQVVDMEGKDAFVADYDRVVELVLEGQVCGNVRGSRLKYVELLVPISNLKPTFRGIETAASITARTNLGAYRQHLEEKTCWSLHACRGIDGAVTTGRDPYAAYDRAPA